MDTSFENAFNGICAELTHHLATRPGARTIVERYFPRDGRIPNVDGLQRRLEDALSLPPRHRCFILIGVNPVTRRLHLTASVTSW